jgi:hypothetical protein
MRHQRADGFEMVATTGTASTVLTGMRVDSAERGAQAGDAGANRYMHRSPVDR